MIQSWTVRRSVGVWDEPGSAVTVYMKISPNPVAIGPSDGSTACGSCARTSFKRSPMSWRAK